MVAGKRPASMDSRSLANERALEVTSNTTWADEPLPASIRRHLGGRLGTAAGAPRSSAGRPLPSHR